MIGIAPGPSVCIARRWRIGGRVQGVGFRPFVYRLAARYQLAGWVRNRGGVVEVLAQGAPRELSLFRAALTAEAPPAARAQLLSEEEAAPEACGDFQIRPSPTDGPTGAYVPPDLFACEACLAELSDPRARRYRYPFTNCTQCGPRYTLIRALPYDRPNTAMAGFQMCAECSAEYTNPRDRRFHAQPLACPRCGPRVRWSWGPLARAAPAEQKADRVVAASEPATQAAGALLEGELALRSCLAALARGQIVAARGIGGYHLLCDARSETAVAELRRRKHRPAKPLALMLPWRGADGLDAVRAVAGVSDSEAATLIDAARPIVLLSRRADARLAAGVAPGLSEIGVMLPYSPLHHLLLDGFGGALVATSGNISGEPVLTEADEAQERLSNVADGFLHHDRPIVRPADDPVARTICGRSRALRLGRGTAPLELTLPEPLPQPTLAVGAYLKNTIALGWDDRAVISPHLGDLGSPRAQWLFERLVSDLQQLYGVRARLLVHDAHSGFPNSRWVRHQGLPTRAIWHHHAHAAALAGEWALREPLLCYTWDGVGLGPDGTLWGGEALLGGPGRWRRVAGLRPFALPGAERAARAPWRSALGLCWSYGLSWPEGEAQLDPLVRQAFDRGLNAPLTSAAGRLFDAAAALLGVCREASYEAEAPMRLEALAASARPAEVEALELPLVADDAGIWRIDCAPLIAMLLDARHSLAQRACRFHMSLAAAICKLSVQVRAGSGVARVGLCGGVFQNRLLCEAAVERLTAAGFEVWLPERLPANDAAISFGQLVEAAALTATGQSLRDTGSPDGPVP